MSEVETLLFILIMIILFMGGLIYFYEKKLAEMYDQKINYINEIVKLKMLLKLSKKE